MKIFKVLFTFVATFTLPHMSYGIPIWNSVPWNISPTGLTPVSSLQSYPAALPSNYKIAASTSTLPSLTSWQWPWAGANLLNPWFGSSLNLALANNDVLSTETSSCISSQSSSPYIVEIAKPQVYVQKQPNVKILSSDC